MLRLAAVSALEVAVREQLRKKADVNSTDQQGCSPLMLASGAGHVGTCRILIDVGADLELVDTEGNDALMLAISRDHDDVVALLRRCLPSTSVTSPASM